MHEAIFHFPCSICWHGKAAGLCPRSSCISSPGQSLLRASGQILGRIPAPTSGALPPCSGKDPAPTHSAAPGLLGEESPVVIYPSSPPRSPERYQRLAPSPRGRGRQGGGGSSPPHPGSARLGSGGLRGATAPPPGTRRRRPPGGSAELRGCGAGPDRGGTGTEEGGSPLGSPHEAA